MLMDLTWVGRKITESQYLWDLPYSIERVDVGCLAVVPERAKESSCVCKSLTSGAHCIHICDSKDNVLC